MTMFVVKLLPETVYDCGVEFVLTGTFPNERLDGETVILGLVVPVPLTETFCVVAPVLVCVMLPE